MNKLSREFYHKSAVELAKDLLGKVLVHHPEEGITSGRIVEAEAYMGMEDAAAHSYKGKRGGRAEVMFGPGGFGYVYLIYGMYYCFNVVSNAPEIPQAVLIRAIEPLDGIDLMIKRRKTCQRTNNQTIKTKNLCNGPGKLCVAMDITKKDNGIDLCGDSLYILDAEKIPEGKIISTPRINIDYAGEAKDYLWRFLIKE